MHGAGRKKSRNQKQHVLRNPRLSFLSSRIDETIITAGAAHALFIVTVFWLLLTAGDFDATVGEPLKRWNTQPDEEQRFESVTAEEDIR